MEKIKVIGAGLAGVEAVYFLINKGYQVDLYEKRPLKNTPAHHSEYFAELVCSNSLKSNRLDNACGLLKEEMRHMNSLTMKVANETQVPSGNALSVDRDLFASKITEIIKSSPLVKIHYEEVETIDTDEYTIIATGPLSSDTFIANLKKYVGDETLNFFDACSPIVEKDSIDFSKAYYKSRYDQGDDSYINCAMNKEEYLRFYNELINAKTAPLHEMDTKYFEGCMPVEAIAKRGEKTLRYGPLKPMGLGKTSEDKPFAVVQLRQDNVQASLYNIVGFQTNLTYSEQKRVFGLIPGLENASYVRYGLMHRNTYVCAPKVLNKDLSIKGYDKLFIAGQLSGVEGYVESAATGILAAINVVRRIEKKEPVYAPIETILGALVNYITFCSPKNFSPMNANFGIMGTSVKDKEEIAKKSLKAVDEWWQKING
ncbi:MAG: methylenetetrahydrofolate--tRNA-(uracil(54)-C(5))-methyltransferase (FADH(2)-oxidizing) TrmFO [Bacilli bacterium]